MDLDHRAAEAAALLRDEVESDVEVDAAYGRVLSGVGRRRARTAGLRLGVVALVGFVAVGALAVVSTGGSGPRDPDQRSIDRDLREGEDEELALDSDLTPQGAAILGGLPDGPLDGKESWRLPVVADRNDELVEGDEVTLYGRGFQPGELVGASTAPPRPTPPRPASAPATWATTPTPSPTRSPRAPATTARS